MVSLQDNAWIDEAVEKIVKKMDLVSERSRNKIPYTAKTVFMMTEAGRIRHFRWMTE